MTEQKLRAEKEKRVAPPDEHWTNLLEALSGAVKGIETSVRLFLGEVIERLIVSNRGTVLGREAASRAKYHGTVDNSLLTFPLISIDLRTRLRRATEFSALSTMRSDFSQTRNSLKQSLMRPILFLIALLSCNGLVYCAEEFHFQFAPPDGTRLLSITQRQITLIKMPGQEVSKQREDMREEYRFRKMTEGYGVETVYRQMNSIVDDRPWTNPVTRILVGLTNKLIVSDDGCLLSAPGTEKITAAVKELMPAPLRPAISKELSAEALEEEEKRFWLQTFCLLSGKTLRLGESFTHTFEQPAQQRPPVHGLFFLTGVTNFGKLRAVRVQYFVSTDPADVSEKQFDKHYLANPVDFHRQPFPAIPFLRISGWRWYEPETMMIVREESFEQSVIVGSIQNDWKRIEWAVAQ